MNWALARQNAFPSLRGWFAYAAAHPRHAVSLAMIRILYSLTGKVVRPWTDPFGFVADTPGTIVCYWSIFVARLLDHPTWVHHIEHTDSPCVVDVGANAGVFTHRVCRMNPAARIISIEPQVNLATRIQKYAEEHGANITVVPAACSDCEGSVRLYRRFEGDVGATIVEDFFEKHQSLSRHDHVESVTVPVLPLDQIVPEGSGQIDLLKIDVEGNDVRVLAGAAKVLQRTRYLLAELRGDAGLQEAMAILGETWTAERLGLHDCFFTNRGIEQ